ncbi:UNVERIFIED_CONTAM: hypothetical protein PYX00_005665 [Menopon gallinae]|uniref:Uncharacterized protein n=1 Tax=Menopon gallinae TaxID=328185 RepID=A0AAW2HSZ5_9NEOP
MPTGDHESRTDFARHQRDVLTDQRGLDWLPSQKTDTQNKPWNTVGIPYKPDQGTNFVRKVAKEIEQKQCRVQYQNLRKEAVEDKIDASEARLFWKEKERMMQNQSSRPESRRSFTPEGEKPEDVIILKLDRAKGILLTPNDTVTLVSLTESDLSGEGGNEPEKEQVRIIDDKDTNWNYEENWKKKDLGLWNSEFYFPRKAEKILEKVVNENTHIPRVQSSKSCKMCKSFFANEKCCKCGNVKVKSHDRKWIRRSTDSNRPVSNLSNSLRFLETQKSRTNFFGNSGSYTLRCNLNPVKKIRTHRRKFYLIPQPLRVGYFKSLEGSEDQFEDFVAKKKNFLRERATSGKSFGEADIRSEAVMW